MKQFLLPLFFLLGLESEFEPEDPCDDYVLYRDQLTELKTDYNNEVGDVSSDDIASKARMALGPQQECYSNNPGDYETEVKRAYALAMMYYDAEYLEDAIENFLLCRNHPGSKNYIHGTLGKSYHDLADDYATFLMSKLNEMGSAENRTVFVRASYGGGKAGISKSIMEEISYSDQNSKRWTSEDIEVLLLRKKLIKSTEEETMISMIKGIAKTDKVALRAPFIVAQADVKPAKEVSGNKESKIGKVQNDDFDIMVQRAAPSPDDDQKKAKDQSGAVAKYAHGFYKHLRANFTKRSPEYYIPIYTYTGSYSKDGYDEFSGFAKQVHMMRPQGRIAYFNDIDNSLMVWLASGYGTLNHEIVHAVLRDDYDEIPGWLDEGMAAFYEEVRRNRKPLDNYRLDYVQTALNDLSCFPKLSDIMKEPKSSFITGERVNLNAAIARYLVMYLADKRVLKKLYRSMRDSDSQEPGYQFNLVLDLLGADEPTFEEDWKKWVLKKRIPEKWLNMDLEVQEYIGSLNCKE